ncbi:hypothetical protein CF326_g7484, partial [Tilletia indica]
MAIATVSRAEQTVEDQVILDGFGTIVNALGMRCKPYLSQIVSTILWRLGNKNAKTRQQAADLVTKLAVVIRHCGEDALLSKLGVGLFEQLGEEFPEALACRLSAISGCIAKAIGPQDVLQVLLTNLRVQERQSRVCSTVAIAIVAETCSPFTTIPHILQEYRTPELNVRNGCLKALSFLFEYIGEMGKDYVNSVVTLLEDALMDR